MSQQDDGLFREVEEELRRERLEKIWKDYGTFFIAGAVVIVLGVLGYKYWENQRATAAYDSGARYEAALRQMADKKDAEAKQDFDKLATDGSGGYRALALLQLAGAQYRDGNRADALKTFERLATDGQADSVLRGFATLQAAGLRLDEADFAELESRLTPLMAEGAPWRYSARELLGLAAFRAGKFTDARALLTPLFVEQEVPESIATRAQIIMAEIAAGELAASGKKADAAETTAPEAGAKAADAAKPAEVTPAPAPAVENADQSSAATPTPSEGATSPSEPAKKD
ncbi:tetratricopeptide repeat protein [Hyphomicrobium sp. D-2]|uniref:tetratricopeptide repeat protein n=1 Tax=Hyphomicrobium sp. D-2 TaxID=3041621 RepID=UPI0024539033|nr:tetratricopeptide repeat protein [Hyphomicrobium sp. D-2]MDH4983912.1 tetratricopeptide repeat protein [Hyphomicrobium sp. D-2]